MENEAIKRLALARGFTERLQPDGSLDLNPYVYDFARDCMKAGQGLKNHQIAQLVNAVRDALAERWELPQMLRGVISGAVGRYLEANGLTLDSSVKRSHRP